MAIIFKPKWNQEIKSYVKKYGEYQAFLNTLNEQMIKDAFIEAEKEFNDEAILSLIKIANNSDTTSNLIIEQGSHQPEDLENGGFCLHFTGRDSHKLAYHFYIMQRNDGSIYIIRISYKGKDKKIRMIERK